MKRGFLLGFAEQPAGSAEQPVLPTPAGSAEQPVVPTPAGAEQPTSTGSAEQPASNHTAQPPTTFHGVANDNNASVFPSAASQASPMRIGVPSAEWRATGVSMPKTVDRRMLHVGRGSWIRTLRSRTTSIRLRFWTQPPSLPLGSELVEWNFQPDTFIGPVHDVAATQAYTSVQVPHPDVPGYLVWANIVDWFGKKPQPFCNVVSATELRWWASRGWHHEFVD